MKQNFKRKLLAGVLSVCMIFQTAGMVPVYAVENAADSGIPVGASSVCENHTEHDEECGYVEGTKGSPCTHEHTEDCYIEVEKCIHKHTDECYPETDDEEATKSDAEEPTECTHMCDEESGCFTKKLNCQHEHDEACGYVEAVKGSPCTHSCELCAKDGEEAIKEDVVEDIELATDSNAQEISKENIAKVQAMIDALPTLEELKAIIDKDEQTAIYTKLQTAYEAYEALTKEEQGEVVGAEIFEPLFGWYNSQMMLMAEQNIAIEPLEGATQYYATLADALTAAQTDENSGCTVKLLTDVTTTEQIEVKTGKFTLDFNGHTWSYNKDADYTAALSVYGADVTLTATGGGGGITYTAGTDGSGFLLWMYGWGSLTITGGEYNSNSSTRVTVVRAENLTQPGQLTITGGTFIVTDNSEKKATMQSVLHVAARAVSKSAVVPSKVTPAVMLCCSLSPEPAVPTRLPTCWRMAMPTETATALPG
ncbi:MAG: hypothetical protein PHN80_10215 [Hespellia sp.]|nr:hypothetical protein [Hespellia sp.]